jgi:VanZ family protein
MMVSPPERRWRALAWVGLAAILAATLHPEPASAGNVGQTPLLCLVCGKDGGTDVILNLLLFIPFAVGLRLSGWSWKGVSVACATLSFGVELCQYLGIPGRDASLSDLLTNTTGGSAAAAAAPLLRSALLRNRPTRTG